MKERFIKKYMRQAKHLGEDDNNCYSRHIGAIVVREYEDGSSRILGTGYNSPPRDVPHCDDKEYLEDIFWPQLTWQEKKLAYENAVETAGSEPTIMSGERYSDEYFRAAKKFICSTFAGCKTCPRKIVGAASGERLELCSCAHAEANAIINAGNDLHGAYMFCWCPLPCRECTKDIINAGIKTVVCLISGGDYSSGSRWMMQKKGIEIIEHVPDYYLE